jgi:hypothetical protein
VSVANSHPERFNLFQGHTAAIVPDFNLRAAVLIFVDGNLDFRRVRVVRIFDQFREGYVGRGYKPLPQFLEQSAIDRKIFRKGAHPQP